MRKTIEKPLKYLSYTHRLRLYSSIKPSQAIRHRKVEQEQKTIWETTLPRLLLNQQIQDWKTIREELVKAGQSISLTNVDSIVLNFYITRNEYVLGYSYMEFLKQLKFEPNLSTVGKYFKLFYMKHRHAKQDKPQEAAILSLYQQLRKKYQILDAFTCENAIQALSLTENWEECFKLLDEIKIASDPCTVTYNVLAELAFRKGRNDVAWKLLSEMIDKNREINNEPYLAYLQQCEEKNGNLQSSIEELFEFFKLCGVKCSSEVAEKIRSVTQKININSSIININNRGICQNCKRKLQKYLFSEKDFKAIKETVLQNVIIGKDVFVGTTPEELRNFQEFSRHMEKYDVVIDGLNVAYCAGTKQPPHILSQMVASVVDYFHRDNKKVLLLGRVHMNNWPNWSKVTQHVDTFLTRSLSQDDPYMLYCALHSGLNTIVVSRDLMRSHVFKLRDTKLKILFSQWLAQNLYQLQYVSNQGKVFFKYPLPYVVAAQKDENQWHIPFYEQNNSADSKWLCLRF